MSEDLLAALCLVAVIEGLFLLAAADAWKRIVAQMGEMPSGTLRLAGGIMAAMGLLALQWVRG
ncbi:MAG: hypothetical protein KatS3mg126_1168 [Lysobacteraceae bacterium]|nr:MAG: hypothetical protein KatS3mg126_1168 [Xanthomonadaceae bacterium]